MKKRPVTTKARIKHREEWLKEYARTVRSEGRNVDYDLAMRLYYEDRDPTEAGLES